jgi:ABC-2 type transport system ATP-binding protein
MNPGWDQQYALDRLHGRGIALDRRISKLSGGQRTQVALVMALAKRPKVLVLDEPLADLDPLARREVMGAMMADLAERDVTVVLSSHVLADLARVCDWLVLIESGRVQLADSIDVLLSEHRRLIGPVDLADGVLRRLPVVSEQRGERQAVLLVRPGPTDPVLDPRWQVQEPPLEDLVLAYMGKAQAASG